MPLFLIERNYAEVIERNQDFFTNMVQVNGETGVHWLYSFLIADKKKTYCLYEAPNPELIREAAKRLGIPADVIVEVSNIKPEMFV